MEPSRTRWLLLALTAALGGCPSEESPAPEPSATPQCDTVVSVETLRWKRVGPFVGDLGRALELDSETLCQELGVLSCEKLYRLPLGGSDPFGAAIYRAPTAPMNTTPALVERVTLAACAQRVELDRAATPVVFKHIDLEASSISNSPEVSAQIDELYKRFLARLPTDEERATVAALTEDSSAADFAVVACFTIGTTTEFLFF